MKSLDSKVLCVKYFNGIERSKGAEISCHRLYELYYIINAAQIEISKAEDKNLDSKRKTKFPSKTPGGAEFDCFC